ncbi:MAG: hypothetical protein V7L26_28355 [Nostoc sp.]
MSNNQSFVETAIYRVSCLNRNVFGAILLSNLNPLFSELRQENQP